MLYFIPSSPKSSSEHHFLSLEIAVGHQKPSNDLFFLFSALQIAKLLQSLANRHVVGSHFKEEYMQPLQSFALAHVDAVQVSIPCQVERLVCGHSSLFGICQRTVSREN